MLSVLVPLYTTGNRLGLDLCDIRKRLDVIEDQNLMNSMNHIQQYSLDNGSGTWGKHGPLHC